MSDEVKDLARKVLELVLDDKSSEVEALATSIGEGSGKTVEDLWDEVDTVLSRAYHAW